MTPKQLKFVQEYMLDGNATQAAIRAGYSEATAGQQGHRLLKNVEIQQALSKLQEGTAEKHEVTVESITKELDLAYKAAAKFKQSGAMVSALQLKAKLYGLIVDKHENVNEPTAAERAKRLDQLLDARARMRTDQAAGDGAAGPRPEPAQPVSPVQPATRVPRERLN